MAVLSAPVYCSVSIQGQCRSTKRKTGDADDHPLLADSPASADKKKGSLLPNACLLLCCALTACYVGWGHVLYLTHQASLIPVPRQMQAITNLSAVPDWSFTYQQTYDLVAELAREFAAPDHSWAVGWDDLADAAAGPGLSRRASSMQQATTAGPLLRELVAGLNEVHNSSSRATWDSIMASVLPSVKAVAAWWSSEQAPSMPATLVTFGTLDRLQQLRAQCLHWQGPLSAAIYLPLLQTQPGPLSQQNREALRLAVLRVMHLATELQRSADTACQLSVLLVYEVIGEEATMPLYPLNTLRNLARLQARTPLSVLLDVDLLPSRSLVNRLTDMQKSERLVHQVLSERLVFIVPAFDMTPDYEDVAWAEALVSAPDKAAMTMAMGIRAVEQFHVRTFARGHNLTQFDTWRHAYADYETSYEWRCEPWVLGPSALMPWSDERYRGWGNDKIQTVNNLHHVGFTFMVMHDAYAIHRPHAKATVMLQTSTGKQGRGYASISDFVWVLLKQQARLLKARQKWQAATSAQLQNCLGKLSWWRLAGGSS